MAIHSNILAWRIPRTEELGRLQPMGSQRVRHDWETNTFTFIAYTLNIIIEEKKGWISSFKLSTKKSLGSEDFTDEFYPRSKELI